MGGYREESCTCSEGDPGSFARASCRVCESREIREILKPLQQNKKPKVEVYEPFYDFDLLDELEREFNQDAI